MSADRQVVHRRLRRAVAVASVFAGWELYARVSANRLTPSLEQILAGLWDDLAGGDLWFHGRLTLELGLVGLGLACLFGVPLGILMARNRWVDAAVEPLLGATYAVPKLALYPAFALILGIGAGSKIWLVALECLYPIAYNTYAGARAVDRSLVWVARNAGAGPLRTMRQVTLPACLSPILTGVRIAAPIMLIVIVVSEMIGSSRGLGFMLIDAQARFQPAGAMAVVIVLGAVGFALDRLIVLARDRAAFWERRAEL